MITVLQANVNRSRLADSLLLRLIEEKRADILIISEQYVYRSEQPWISDTLDTAAIWTVNKNVAVNRRGQERGFVWIKNDNVTIISTYLSPTDRIDEFQQKLADLEDFICETEGEIIVAGDFNARGQEWGMPTTDSRGRQVLEMAARRGLNVVNIGNTPTFRRAGNIGTIPDITFATDGMMCKIKNWRVIEDFTGSDHQYIVFNIEENRGTINPNHPQMVRWNVNRFRPEIFDRKVEEGKLHVLQTEGTAEEKIQATMQLVKQACDVSMPRKSFQNKRWKPVYWWSEEIAELRRSCLHLRRKVTRRRRRRDENLENELEEFKTKRQELRRAIKQSKKRKFEELRQDINSDPWGLGYKIVIKKLGNQKNVGDLKPQTMQHIVNTLFPAHPIRPPDGFAPSLRLEIPAFSDEELKVAANALKNKKAPGLDGIPVEALKQVAQSCPQLLLNMYNSCLREGVFPKRWKMQRLVLLSKNKGQPDSPSAYRPLCMLDTAGKLLEKLLQPRLLAAIERRGDLSPKQYGFRKGRSTLGAIGEVVRAAKSVDQRNHYSREIVLLATLDVRNAFNSVRWTDILTALERKYRIPEYLLLIVRDYLRDRELIYQTTEGPKRRSITAGAAQGSILGPDLWNISYDDILCMEMPENSFLVGYADDVAAVITARDTESAQRTLNQVMRKTMSWMEDHGLALATEKTEVVLLTKKRIPTIVDFRIDTEIITSKCVVKYLGIRIDTKLSFWEQIRSAAERASKVTASLTKLMANIGGPTASKRKLLMTTTHAVLLYGSEIWAEALKQEKYRKQMAAVQRRGALRITSAYRTVSEPAVLVIAGVTPIDLLAAQRKYVYEKKAELGIEAATAEGKALTQRKWQERWESDNRGRWTAQLIGNVDMWSNRKHGEVNFYVTQFLTGHGYFNAYLHKMGKTRNSHCQYGDSTSDDVFHTVFECWRWEPDRQNLNRSIGEIRQDNIIHKMLENEEQWTRISSHLTKILKTKKREEPVPEMTEPA